jgi:hypothetical protein
MTKEQKRNILAVIKKEAPRLSSLLDEKDAATFKGLTHELRDTWTKKQIYRTHTEMEISVLQDAKHPTNASKYWQCVREQNHFMENLIESSFDYRETEVKLEQERIKRDKEKDKLKKRLNEIEIDKLLFRMANMQLGAKDRVRELREWSYFKKKYDDGTFDTQHVDTNQLESLEKIYSNKKKTLSPYASQPEVFNILGQKMSIERVKGERILLEQEKKKALDNLSSKKKI